MKTVVRCLLGVAGLMGASLILASTAQAAVTPASQTVDCSTSFANLTFTGAVGESFTITNSGGLACGISGISGVVTGSGNGFLDFGGGQVYLASNNQPATFTIVGPGTFTLDYFGAGSASVTVSTTTGATVVQTPPSYQFTYWLPGTPAVECVSLRQTLVSGTQLALPGADAPCRSVAGANLVGWQIPGLSEPLNLGQQVVVSGDQRFTAVFSTTNISVTQNANVGADVPCLVNGQPVTKRYETSSLPRTSLTLAKSATCAPSGLSLKGWNTRGDGKGTTYAPGATVPAADVASLASFAVYAVWGAPSLVMDPAATTVQTGAIGTVTVRDPGMAGQTVAVSASGSVLLANSLAASTLTLGADGAASVTFIAGTSAGPGTVKASAGGVTASATIEVTKPEERTISIVGQRTTVSGKPGISVDGMTTGFAAGTVVKPYVKFPGQTEYSEGSARPVVAADGSFAWSRKTGKKAYVYFTSEDGSVRSDRVIIPAL